jgi:hypothetical protein
LKAARKPKPLGGGAPPSVTALAQQLDATTPDGEPDYDTQREAAAALIEAMRPLLSPLPTAVRVRVVSEP